MIRLSPPEETADGRWLLCDLQQHHESYAWGGRAYRGATLADAVARWRMARRLATIRVLYREPYSLSLWGIPYEMRCEVNQSPRDIFAWRDSAITRTGVPPWIWLGTPGWFNQYTRPQIDEIKAWLVVQGDKVPENPHEWCAL